MKINGIKVVDAKGKRSLVITAKDIKEGWGKDPENCAAARALTREPGVEEARVHLARVFLKPRGGNWVRYFTPKALRDEIVAYDRGGHFEPGAFVLKPVQATAALGSKRPQYKNTGKFPQKGVHSKPHVIHGVRPNGRLGQKYK